MLSKSIKIANYEFSNLRINIEQSNETKEYIAIIFINGKFNDKRIYDIDNSTMDEIADRVLSFIEDNNHMYHVKF